MLALTIAALTVPALAFRRAQRGELPRPFLASLAIGIAALMVLVMIASAIAPMLLLPCD